MKVRHDVCGKTALITASTLDNLSFEEKRTVLREVVEKVVIKDSEISIYSIIHAQGELDDIEDVSIASRSS
jgi:hypothetical protein